MSKLPPGPYTIVSKLTDQLIGHQYFKDFAIKPREVVNREEETEPQEVEWALEEAGDGLFHLIVSEYPTAIIDKKIYALMADKESAVSWSLNRQPQHGVDVFTIENGEEGGWILPSKGKEIQVIFGPLCPNLPDPPQYPDDELWVIRPIFK